MSLFELRGKLTSTQNLVWGIFGLVFLIALWWGLAELLSRPSVGENFDAPPASDSLGIEQNVSPVTVDPSRRVYPLLPRPDQVVKAFPRLVSDDDLMSNTWRSVWLNLQGYFWAIFVSIPIGFLIGLFPIFRSMFGKQVDALRYLPLTALTGLFIIWFGIEDRMKIAFLAFGIIVYLLPVVVQRIDEVEDVYIKTVFTLGAKTWQTIRSVYLPSVMSRLIDDIRVLTAISWTYIIIAELLNRQGGLGGLIYLKQRQGQVDKLFAILIIIVAIGYIQDRLFVYFDKRLFPHKYYKSALKGLTEVEYGLLIFFGSLALAILLPAFIPALAGKLGVPVLLVVITSVILILFGEFKIQKNYVEQD
ncbi:MAG TPA: ABC transporter permease subunit [Flavilitoribacter sp.]|nr:ABC transporter permease subunit [Flavilitoribacter sp.]